MEIDPKDVYALHALGGLYQKIGDRERAEAMQVAVLQIDKTHKAARYALANLELDSSRYDEAERELTRLQADGAKPLAEYGFARLAALHGKAANAAQHLETLLQLGVAHPSKVLTDEAFPAIAVSVLDVEMVISEISVSVSFAAK